MNKIHTVVQYYRKPYPSGNWCPKYCAVFKGKSMVECRLNSSSIKYIGKSGDKAVLSYDDASNIIHDLRKTLEWDEILDMGQVELTVSEFKRYEKMFKAKWDFHKRGDKNE